MPTKAGQGEGYFLRVNVRHSLGRQMVLHEPQIPWLKGDLQTLFWRIRKNKNMKQVWSIYIFRSPSTLLQAWPPNSLSRGHYAYAHLRIVMLKLSRLSKVTKLMSNRLQFEPRSVCLTLKPWLPAITLYYFPIHSLHKCLLSICCETGTVLGAWNTTMDKSDKNPRPQRSYI